MALLGEVLLKNKMVSHEKLVVALEEQKRTGELMGDVLVRLGIVSAKDLAKAMALSSDIPFIDLKHTAIDPAVISSVPKKIAKKFKLVPFAEDGDSFRVAMDNPNDVMALDTLRSLIGKTIEIYAADLQSINETIEMYYELEAASLEEEIDRNIQAAMSGGLAEGEVTAPIVRLIELILIVAIRDNATDVHITPEERASRISYRIDGILRSSTILPKRLQLPVVNRLKIMSGMDIAEQRLPQEGNTLFAFSGRDVDIRTSTSPCLHGENVVLRILDKSSLVLGLGHLGLDEDNQRTVQRLVNKPHGIVLSAGPTGSGKTTTLYSVLREVNALEKNVLTIEDPIEYKLALIKQTQVNEQAGLTFSEAIRHFLRQDPDIILIGEIRDLETAKIAMQAALTGHLVLSTIHTNDAATTIPRLIDLGVEPYMIPTTLRAVIAQRLLRRICSNCMEDYQPTDKELSIYGLVDWQGRTLKRGTGCYKCLNRGYQGRIGVFEILEVTPSISKLISEKASADIIMQEAKQEGMLSLKDDGLNKVEQGITTLEELFRWI